MSAEKSCIVPDYYTRFACKGGSCTGTCCRGWNVSVSMEEYLRLLGLDCSPALRQKLDRAFLPAEHPTPQRYAVVFPTWEGSCPVLREDGLCALHAELGEGVLPAVCRSYPRSCRGGECACSNSCEGVLELLAGWEPVMGFREVTLPWTPPEAPESLPSPALRRRCIEILQERQYTLPCRLLRLGLLLENDPPLPDTALPVPRRPVRDTRYTLGLQLELVRVLGERSPSIRDACEKALRQLGLTAPQNPAPEAAAAAYDRAAAHLYALVPDLDRRREQVLVNHLFYEKFPYAPSPATPWDAYRALCGMNALLRFLTVSTMAWAEDASGLPAVMSSAFRLMEHSSFSRNAAIVLDRAGCIAPGTLAMLATV